MNLKRMVQGAAIGGLAAITAACAPMATRAEQMCDPYGVPGANYIEAGDEFRGEVAGTSFGYRAVEQRGGTLVTFEHDGRSARVFVPSNVALIGEYGDMLPNVSPDWQGVDRLSVPVVGCDYVDVARPNGDREGIGRGDRLEPVFRHDGAVGGYLTMFFGSGVNRLQGGR